MAYHGGASHLASIYGSEQDKVNCSFYLKIGACRHGERCSRKHIKPQYSQTVLIQNLYRNPAHREGSTSNPHLRSVGVPWADPTGKSDMSEQELRDYFDQFYEDVFCELSKYGNLLEMHVCHNVADHLVGNTYARYEWEDEASAAVEELNKRWFAGRPVYAELSPVTDFREACCKQNDMGECSRGGFCNFMHLRQPGKELRNELYEQQRLERKLNPDPRAEERKKELEMFGESFGAGGPAGGDDYDRRGGGGREHRDRDRDDRRGGDHRRREESPRRDYAPRDDYRSRDRY